MFYVIVKELPEVLAICEINHEACSRDANKVRGKVGYFINIEAKSQVVYFMCSTHGSALTVLRNCL